MGTRQSLTPDFHHATSITHFCFAVQNTGRVARKETRWQRKKELIKEPKWLTSNLASSDQAYCASSSVLRRQKGLYLSLNRKCSSEVSIPGSVQIVPQNAPYLSLECKWRRLMWSHRISTDFILGNILYSCIGIKNNVVLFFSNN